MIDDMKCNSMSINLVQDQFLHVLQIAATLIFYVMAR